MGATLTLPRTFYRGGGMTNGTVGVALIGSGRMGAFHAETVALRLPAARLAAGAAPAPGAAERLAGPLGADRACTDPAQLWEDPAVEAVVIAAPARAHAALVAAAAGAGRHVFCEKPMAVTLPDAGRSQVFCGNPSCRP